MKIVAFYGKAARLVKEEQFEELLEALGKAWGESVKTGFFFAKDLADRLRGDFPGLSERYLKGNECVFSDVLPPETDLVVCLGGDGTMLDTLPLVQDSGVPVLGINYGRLGFLNAINADRVRTLLNPGFIERFRKDRRLLLEVGDFELLGRDSVSIPNKQPYALNEVAVVKSETESLILLDVLVDGQYMNTYYGDGVLFSTPTGSTAYALSVGGPILMPQNHSLVISPVASHSLNLRPVVIPDNWCVDLKVSSRSGNFMVSLDGRSQVLDNKTGLHIQKAPFCTYIAKRRGHTYFQTLREKFLWGADVRL